MNQNTKTIKLRKEKLAEVLLNPKARFVENKYRAIASTISKMYPEKCSNTEANNLILLCKQIVAIDRNWRLATAEIKKEQKLILSQQWQLDNL